jgi:ubiquinone biosynthesis monooxygenase Coq7
MLVKRAVRLQSHSLRQFSTSTSSVLEEIRAHPLPTWLVTELRTNQAGEYGAVRIYEGALVGLKLRNEDEQQALNFLEEHKSNEFAHLQIMNALTAETASSTKLFPLWHVAGFITGLLPALFGGKRAVYHTIVAIETFVEEHYQEQIQRLKGDEETSSAHKTMIKCLSECCEDEVGHRREAEQALLAEYDTHLRHAGPMLYAWTRLVDVGSRLAVVASRAL